MDPLWKKLNLKDQELVVVINAPASFEPVIERVGEVKVQRSFGRTKSIPFALVFATKQSEIDNAAEKIRDCLDGDMTLWFAYPKKTSKNFDCDFDRDMGWESLGKVGFEGVRQVAIDDDWSTIRFRRVDFIKTMKRSSKMAISKEGKARTKK